MSFLTQLVKIINTGQSRSVILHGNVYDLFFDHANNKYVPLVNLLMSKCQVKSNNGKKGITQIIYQVNRPLEINGDTQELETYWRLCDDKPLKERIKEAAINYGNYALTFELMRQMTVCMRLAQAKTKNNLVFIIESADMLLPEAEISRMTIHDRKLVAIMQDWITDPEFVEGHDTLVMLSESRSAIHSRISRQPQITSIDIPLPDLGQRYHFVDFCKQYQGVDKACDAAGLAKLTSGLSIHALRQLLASGNYSPEQVTGKVEEYMVSQLGEGVVEFKRPKHKLDKVIGFSAVKAFIKDELLPGFLAENEGAISGMAMSGPIGGGKTFIGEAIAAEMDIPVIVLKNIRSKWFGETDSIFERLRRLLESFHKIIVFVDEADTIFGDIQSDHDTERRLTGKIQAMMSDTALKGKVIWLLMTARIHRLSPDIRRPGRMDIIIPILDPEDEDRREFIRWTFGDLFTEDKIGDQMIYDGTLGFSSASFAMLRSAIKGKKCKTLDEALKLLDDMILPDIEKTRKYQTLQARLNCTRKSLLGLVGSVSRDRLQSLRENWAETAHKLEAEGIS